MVQSSPSFFIEIKKKFLKNLPVRQTLRVVIKYCPLSGDHYNPTYLKSKRFSLCPFYGGFHVLDMSVKIENYLDLEGD